MELKGITLQYDIPSQKFMSFGYSFALTKGTNPQEALTDFGDVLQSLKDIIDEEFKKIKGAKKEESGMADGYEVKGTYGYTEEKVSPAEGPACTFLLSYALKYVTEIKGGMISIQHKDTEEKRLFRIYDELSKLNKVEHSLLARISMRRIAGLRDGATWLEAFAN